MRRLLLTLASGVIAASACGKAPPPIAEEPTVALAASSPSAALVPTLVADAQTPDLGGASRDAPRTPLVREAEEVIVGGVKEQWRIEWISTPTRACFDEQWATCPCYGFAFGETGDFDLVRERPGAPAERLHLSGTLQRWPVLETDSQRWIDGNVDAVEITRRPEVKLIHLGDYDHDGRATEFVLQVGAGSPCTRTWSEVVGVDRLTGKLHAFGTASRPDKPLVLEYKREWEDVKKSVVTEVTEVGCGDHGSGTMVTDSVRATPRGLEVEVRTYDCIWAKPPDFSTRRGKLLERRPWGSEDGIPN